MNNLQWKIYYGDGSIYDSSQGEPEEAPPINVQVILSYNRENGREIFHFWDWYYYRKSTKEWWGCDIHGLLDQLLHDNTNDIKAVKQGRTIKTELYESILKQAINDEDFPPQSAKTKLDRPKQAYGEIIKK